jgi:FkbM family methyltransferase
MKRSFLFDLGFHHGEGLDYLAQLYEVDEAWTIFCFEANSACRAALLRAGYLRQPRFAPMPLAAYIKAGPILFQRQAETDGGREDGQGSHLAEMELALDCHGAGREEVWAIDFPMFLRAMIPVEREGCFVVVKMDIEGAEYEILRTMLADGSIERVDVLHVEFHQRLMAGENNETTEALREALRTFVKLVEHW